MPHREDTVRAWAKTASRAEIDAVCDVLANALVFRNFGIDEAAPETKRGRPPGSKNRPKEQPFMAYAAN